MLLTLSVPHCPITGLPQGPSLPLWRLPPDPPARLGQKQGSERTPGHQTF